VPSLRSFARLSWWRPRSRSRISRPTATERLDCCAFTQARMRAFARGVFTSLSQSFDGCWLPVVTISTVSPLCSW